jgi:hypothetical protein
LQIVSGQNFNIEAPRLPTSLWIDGEATEDTVRRARFGLRDCGG